MTTLADASQFSDIQRACLEHYDLGHVEVLRPLAGGMFARPLVLRTDQGTFVLRTHTFRATEAAFRFQAETMQWAFEHGVPCAPVKPTRDGAWCLPLPNENAVMAVHRYVEGATDDWHSWHRRKEAGDNFLHDLGGCVARLHNHLATAQPSGDERLSAALPPIQFKQLEQGYRAWRQALGALERHDAVAACTARSTLLDLDARIDAHWQHLLASSAKNQVAALPQQIVHGDVSAVNIVWDRRNQPVFIDWDAVHVGHRLYDALGDVLNRVPDDRPDLNRFRQDTDRRDLAGYASAVNEPLSRQEREMEPVFCLARQLEDLRQRVLVIPDLTREQDQRYARLIRMRVEMMDQIAAGHRAR